MSDEPLPVTLDNIRKWDADMRGSDDRARHIALYYFATNLREVVGVLFAELAEARDKALDEAAEAMENLSFMTDIRELIDMTKQEMSERTCHEAAQAIRALKSPKPPIL